MIISNNSFSFANDLFSFFILSNNLKVAQNEYLESREKLLCLIKKNNLNTPDILILVNLIDTKFNVHNLIKE